MSDFLCLAKLLIPPVLFVIPGIILVVLLASNNPVFTVTTSACRKNQGIPPYIVSYLLLGGVNGSLSFTNENYYTTAWDGYIGGSSSGNLCPRSLNPLNRGSFAVTYYCFDFKDIPISSSGSDDGGTGGIDNRRHLSDVLPIWSQIDYFNQKIYGVHSNLNNAVSITSQAFQVLLGGVVVGLGIGGFTGIQMSWELNNPSTFALMSCLPKFQPMISIVVYSLVLIFATLAVEYVAVTDFQNASSYSAIFPTCKVAVQLSPGYAGSLWFIVAYCSLFLFVRLYYFWESVVFKNKLNSSNINSDTAFHIDELPARFGGGSPLHMHTAYEFQPNAETNVDVELEMQLRNNRNYNYNNYNRYNGDSPTETVSATASAPPWLTDSEDSHRSHNQRYCTHDEIATAVSTMRSDQWQLEQPQPTAPPAAAGDVERSSVPRHDESFHSTSG